MSQHPSLKFKNLWPRIASKLGNAVKHILVVLLCFAILIVSVTSGVMISEFARERGEYTRSHLFDLIENLSARLKGVPSDVEARKGENDEISGQEEEPEETFQQTLYRQTREMADHQAEIDRLMLEELRGGAYTLEEPFVLLDPYGISPLTAVLLFTTEEPMRIDIHVAGDTPQAEVDFAFSEYETEHMIPVYGLMRIGQIS